MAKAYNLEPINKKNGNLKPFANHQDLAPMNKLSANSHDLGPMYTGDPNTWNMALNTNNLDYNKPAYERDWNQAERRRILRQWRMLDSNLSELPEEELKLIQSFYIRFSYLDQSEQALLIKAYHSKDPYNRKSEPLKTQVSLQKIINKLSKFREQPKGSMK
ncbi:hypothetical protein NVV78_07820 [Pediococcus ethanolidurans]|uniref:hypothetical protein n=1 Tax=Pediococcus ethanolidurans TaxID=319653 RepID=UPI0021E9302E|nr:hypothetical protein [Pediococcus ethanolidurans]MCV3315847.1 hypothetical protein [Pediococcus ethanolidurans]MCV3327572.1 hypothetical protein [Pediococcus ethanolidurans]